MYDIFTTATPEVERDKELYKKHTYTYDLLKSRYPEIHKLPDNEVDEMDYNVFINRFKDNAKSRVNRLIDSDRSQSIFKNGWNNRINKY